MSTGVFSVRYFKPNDPDAYAVDWGWNPKGSVRWTCSDMESGIGHQWVCTGSLVGKPTVCHIGIGDNGGTVAIGSDDKEAARVIRGKVTTIALPEVNKEAYQALLEHFGLETWRDEFPPERIATMSPASLAAARREKEKQHNLPRLVIKNDTFGSNDFAEDYPS